MLCLTKLGPYEFSFICDSTDTFQCRCVFIALFIVIFSTTQSFEGSRTCSRVTKWTFGERLFWIGSMVRDLHGVLFFREHQRVVVQPSCCRSSFAKLWACSSQSVSIRRCHAPCVAHQCVPYLALTRINNVTSKSDFHFFLSCFHLASYLQFK